MTVSVRSLNHDDWRQSLAELPPECRDIYFTPEYHCVHEAEGGGVSVCTEIRDGASTLIIPAMRNLVPGSLVASHCEAQYDLQSCNGYGGPLSSPGVSRDFLERAWKAWREECRAVGIVAAFFRLHPLLHNERYLPVESVLVANRKTVYLDYSNGLDALWEEADSNFRNMVRKGRREGLHVRWNAPADWLEVAAFYGDAMERLNAPGALRLSSKFFDAIAHFPDSELASIRVNGELVAVALFFFSRVFCHYHVSARHPRAGNHLHSLILQSAIERSAVRGLVGMHLGGGRTAALDDSLLRFKKSTGGKLCDFGVALVVADAQVFAHLCDSWRELTGVAPSWLLGYRQPL